MYLNTGIIGGPGNKGNLVAVGLLVTGTMLFLFSTKLHVPNTVARREAVLKVVDGITGTLANSALFIHIVSFCDVASGWSTHWPWPQQKDKDALNGSWLWH